MTNLNNALEKIEEALERSLDAGYSSHDKQQALALCKLIREETTSNEWFFRWIARAKAEGYPCSIDEAVGMIWHHPDNPYSKINPWEEKQNDTE